MPVSVDSSRIVYDALKACGIGLVSALPETWLVHLIRMADDDPDMILVRLAKEESDHRLADIFLADPGLVRRSVVDDMRAAAGLPPAPDAQCDRGPREVR